MFHSFGIVQSKTVVPVGTSWISKGICCLRRSKLALRPFPVMLRQMGYRSAMSLYISSPILSLSSVFLKFIEFSGIPSFHPRPTAAKRDQIGMTRERKGAKGGAKKNDFELCILSVPSIWA